MITILLIILFFIYVAGWKLSMLFIQVVVAGAEDYDPGAVAEFKNEPAWHRWMAFGLLWWMFVIYVWLREDT